MLWNDLNDELDHWTTMQQKATFWWRDDDAISDTEALDNLLECSGTVPLALAVIPSMVKSSLVQKIEKYSTISVLQHGWKHVSHASVPNSEYPAGRDPSVVFREFISGHQLLHDFFGAKSLPVFAPPWHGFDDYYIPLLAKAGLKALSRKGPRKVPVTHGVVLSNVHCVPIKWSDPPSFGLDDDYLAVIVDHLKNRRLGNSDMAEPTGLLTHHLVQNMQSYTFMGRLIKLVQTHPAACWLDASAVFHLCDGCAVS